MIGSEGCLGIIVSAVIRIWPLPEVREHDSVILQNFEDGLHFIRAVERLGAHKPVSVRLLDNAHFRLGQALRPADASIVARLRKVIVQLSSSMHKGYDFSSVVCATISYEGTASEVNLQKKMMQEVSATQGGMTLGSEIGKAGYDLTFLIAYLRDFAMTYHLLAESFETFVPWSRVSTLIRETKNRILREHQLRLLPGLPFVGSRVTQLYHEGVCVYFYLCFSFEGVHNASEVFSELEKAARDEILKHGGSLSHHHGIGKLRAGHLKEVTAPTLSATIGAIKKAIDSDNIFGARNGPFAYA
jgi:alkyldihydroxyacetonephosphate synthase